jgi:CRISPR system Cascade subunit CasD
MDGHLLLMLRLEGPLQSWGVRARWDVRDTGDEPTKSGLVGLLGCALGYPLYDQRLALLDRELRLGIRVEYEGIKMTDFQTITGILKTGSGEDRGTESDPTTIISPRTYLQDAAFLAIFDGPALLLQQAAAALDAPKWPLYLGRKSCPPSRPVLECLTDNYVSFQEALRMQPWDWGGREILHKYPGRLRCVMEDASGGALRGDCMRVNPARMYDFRRVSVYHVDFPGARGEI